ncbi:MAG: glycoside hydrolase family 99-like domain-containing protein [Phycisphaerae bacterium]|nr:glycoside hydrolase family 99-like domain-containing protein [Phycisphaerae bacterium]
MRTMILSIFTILVGGPMLFAAPVDIQRWDFDSDVDLKHWVPNSYLASVSVQDGIVSADAVDWDPFFLCRDVSIAANPWQYVVIRLRANRPGIGELFWSGELTGQYGGLTEKKKVRFSVDGDNTWHEIVLFPFWHTEKIIRQLRLDVYEGAHFEIDWIRVCHWGAEASPIDTCAWSFGGSVREWQIHSGASELFAPPVKINAKDKLWITVQLASDQEEVASILWACEHTVGLQTEEFSLKGDGKPHSYNLQMAGNPAWRGNVIAFGIRLPQDNGVRLDSIRFGTEPSGPGELEVRYLGFENGVNRSGRPCRLLAQVQNSGGAPHGIRSIHLLLPKGLKLVTEPERPSHSGLAHNETATFTWEIVAEKPGVFPVRLAFSGKGNLPSDQDINLEFTEPPSVPKADYVPVPRPVETDMEICAFYFPGWNTDAKWDCIRQTAPNRKPLLGYYDEANPECVDWQIKWAVENGISCFLVDWYWVQGRQQLTHWFEGYRKARYRDFLKVAIMWANHNPPNTHSVEDWLNVTREWIDRYFTLPRYYNLDSQPAVFIWNPGGIRSDLGGSDAVKKVLDASQQMARAAGFKGITFVAMNSSFDTTHIRMLLHEGYSGITTYHEWGSVIDGGVAQRRFNYESVVRQSPVSWREKDDASGSLTYYPLVDTGWDSRPWHGNKAMAIEGRTPQGFEQLLREAEAFCRERCKPMLILGPVNEWGEGSYIEPCTDYGFDMLEAIRRIFAKGDPPSWPTNIAPSDIGLGPYDFSSE